MKKEPLISCLCVTRNKPDLLKRAIRCFLAQTYARKELIILYESGDEETARTIISTRQANVLGIEVDSRPKLTLGALRNLSIEECHGDYFCQWDDDDWYHPERLATQWNAIAQSGKPASALTHWLMYDAVTATAFCSHHRIWEGSIMCQTAIARSNIQYPDFSKGEDNHFIDELYNSHGICHLPIPTLYIYTYNRYNTWDYEHFRNLFAKGRQLSSQASGILRQILADQSSIQASATRLTDPVLRNELATYLKNSIGPAGAYDPVELQQYTAIRSA